jgi:hypothetical protein
VQAQLQTSPGAVSTRGAWHELVEGTINQPGVLEQGASRRGSEWIQHFEASSEQSR